jgi:hypothetical protein
VIRKETTLIVHYEDECSTLMLGDLRKFMADVESADNGTDVTIETRLSDGVLADVISVTWDV